MLKSIVLPAAIALALGLSQAQAQSPTASCSATELQLLAAYLERDLAATSAAMRALRAESALEQPEKREALLAAPVSLPTRRLLADAYASDALQYQATCRTPYLDAASREIEKAAFEEIFRVHHALD